MALHYAAHEWLEWEVPALRAAHLRIRDIAQEAGFDRHVNPSQCQRRLPAATPITTIAIPAQTIMLP